MAKRDLKYLLYRAKLRETWLGYKYCSIIGTDAFDLLTDALYEQDMLISNLTSGMTTRGIVALHGHAIGDTHYEFDAIWTAKWIDDYKLISNSITDYNLSHLELYEKDCTIVKSKPITPKRK